MRTNIFLRSTLRQPVKAAFLVIVTALVTFAFAARGLLPGGRDPRTDPGRPLGGHRRGGGVPPEPGGCGDCEPG